jgi:NAD(P)-dependent dehydrogenase (short-subunit alcohol dehydrogenase family)
MPQLNLLLTPPPEPWSERALAFCMGSHQRLGQGSALLGLDEHLIPVIVLMARRKGRANAAAAVGDKLDSRSFSKLGSTAEVKQRLDEWEARNAEFDARVLAARPDLTDLTGAQWDAEMDDIEQLQEQLTQELAAIESAFRAAGIGPCPWWFHSSA